MGGRRAQKGGGGGNVFNGRKTVGEDVGAPTKTEKNFKGSIGEGNSCVTTGRPPPREEQGGPTEQGKKKKATPPNMRPGENCPVRGR